jgi:alpha/beta superfamily hydrolase
MIARLGEPSRLKVVSGADHFFEGRLAEVVSAVSEFVEEYD